MCVSEFIGKKIEILIPARDDRGKEIKGRFVPVQGRCTFAGPNELLGIDMQITLERTPFFNFIPSSIKLIA